MDYLVSYVCPDFFLFKKERMRKRERGVYAGGETGRKARTQEGRNEKIDEKN